VRKKALGEDQYYTAEQKAAMSKEELAKHEEMQAQTRDMKIALDAMSQAMALMNLGEISQEAGDLKLALSHYEKALKVGEELPKGGYINVFEMFRARIRATATAWSSGSRMISIWRQSRMSIRQSSIDSSRW